VIADLHCHYLMHLLPNDQRPYSVAGDWLSQMIRELKAQFDADAIAIPALLFSDRPVVRWLVCEP
jgi:hypothetical protein